MAQNSGFNMGSMPLAQTTQATLLREPPNPALFAAALPPQGTGIRAQQEKMAPATMPTIGHPPAFPQQFEPFGNLRDAHRNRLAMILQVRGHPADQPAPPPRRYSPGPTIDPRIRAQMDAVYGGGAPVRPQGAR